ncbi:MAG TPA: TMEM175 family protein [Kouleothrix sp.]|uniref:TMEM175 family protein n=1 Tax=Kouleothrix sp. TaxID=2779161 RepID=UPI002C1159EA|nr:TMEM175 family protein [Kouleothrix sp.]HRC77064.1 TMEM175 family protein [Kouleothrix sp.]
MSKGRLEAFSDGVFAIIITIMVLELAVPHAEGVATPEQLLPLVPVFLSYVLSFVYVGIYWNNHHHLLHSCKRVSGGALWANLFQLFWLSLIPFTSAWMGENSFAAWPVALYGAVLWMCGVAYYILERTLIAANGKDSLLASAVGIDVKGLLSMLMYTIAVPLAFVNRWVACALYVLVALMWFIPDPRIERALGE